jgi:hypothetical protein
MNSNNRGEPRLNHSLTVNIRYNGQVFSGITQNISKSGMYIEAIDIKSSKSQELSIVAAVDRNLYRMKGEIAWTRNLPIKASKKSMQGIGIKLVEAPTEYLNYVEYLKYSPSLIQ